MSNLVGQQIAHYQIKALLGQGRIGTVYQATDLADQSQVALKVVSLHLAQQPQFRQQFLREVQAIPRLDHPSIIRVHEAGIDTQQDILYMTMEYVTERSLLVYLRQLAYQGRQLRTGEALLIIAQAAEALNYAHQKGVLHRDIRPNIILFKQDEEAPAIGGMRRRVVISDFALATVLEREREPFPGALPYMSPEQCLKGTVDGRSDLYSLGILLYQLVTHQLPFAIKSLDEAIQQHAYQDPRPPRQMQPDLPPVVEGVILKAIAKRPEDRFQTGAAMAAALRQAALALPESMAVVTSQDEGSSTDTVVDSAELLAVQASQWTSDEDRVTITQDIPKSLNRRIVTIGRDEGNDICLPAASVTRRHAQLERTESGWQVRDLGSMNGTFIDGNPLLPDIPEEWSSSQTLRIGPYFLQLQPGKGFSFGNQGFVASVTPNEVNIAPGKQAELQVTVFNQSDAAEEFTIREQRLPASWVKLPDAAFRVRSGEQVTKSVKIQLPLSRDIVAGRTRYLLTVALASNGQEPVPVPGVVNVTSAEEEFSTELFPTELPGKGTCQLLVRNHGLQDVTYAITGRNPEDAVRFSEWRPKGAKEGQPSATGSGKSTSPRYRSSRLRQIPIFRRLQDAPRTTFDRVLSAPRVALNRILPGLGGFLRVERFGRRLAGSATSRRPDASTRPQMAPFNRRSFQKVIYPGQLRRQLTVPAGQEQLLRLHVAPRRRPFLGRDSQTLPFQLQVSTASGLHQTNAGQIEVQPRLRTRWPAALVLFLLLFACVSSGLLYAYGLNPTLAAMLTSPRDMDEDGLSNLSEVYLHQTNPNKSDSDSDGLPDGQEVQLRLSPTNADSDDDGLLDGQEIALSTNPLSQDTDGDELSDSLELRVLNTDPLTANTGPVIRLVGEATPLPQPTAAPEPTPQPTLPPSTDQSTFTSLANQDGYIGQEVGTGSLAFADGEIQIGDDIGGGRQFVGIISFDTSQLPDEAQIQDVRLRLRRSGSAGAPYQLGQIHVDAAPAGGFSGSFDLETSDFSANAAVVNVATLSEAASNGSWAEGALDDSHRNIINRQGTTQFRLYFSLPNNGNDERDWLNFDAGDHPTESYRPQLIVQYQLP